MKEQIKEYARLIATAGANVQKGQAVVIRAQPDQPEFIAELCEQCYKAGASEVSVEWEYQPVSRLGIKYKSLETLSAIRDWEKAKMEYNARTLPAKIYIDSADPDGLCGIDDEKNAAAQKARYPVIKPFLDKTENKYQWCIAAVPGKAWAKKVFPEKTPAQAQKALWDAILNASRAESDPVAAWEEHNRDLADKCARLNALHLKELHYKSSNGTDLKVGLIENSVFCGGAERTLSGVVFNPNIPSEEIFISPKKGLAEGVVYSTRPLSYRGRLIENFRLEFKDGRVVKSHAEKGDDILKTMLSMDEGASYLGECALIPYDSPIRRLRLLFYSTLFDENASCHLALGEGFSNTIKDYEKYTLDECRKMGVNESMIHEDFMIGTRDLDIYGTTFDGKKVRIFKNGNFAI
ncbi:MAG: aminopeptidase [Clostridia bacterium]|nr:aminopeptidase [Clostridia bacterium]